MNIKSFYTHIPHNEGIKSIKEKLAIHRTPNNLPNNSYIIELLEVVLTNNHFEFNDTYYHQVSGTAIGTKLAPSYANLFMNKFEEKYVYTYPLQPILWKRFIDDIFSHLAIWNEFTLGIHKPFEHSTFTIKFTREILPTEIPFLDLIIYTKGSRLYTRLHTKTTYRHMYLNF